jgi:hypothetical protein
LGVRHSKHLKVYVTVLAVGLLGLGADRFVLGSDGPATASAADGLLVHAQADAAQAASAGQAPTGAAAPESAEVPLDSAADATVRVSERLAALATRVQDPATDGFSPGPKFEALARVAEPVVPGAPQTARRELRLSAVMTAGRSPSAVINGTPLQIGQSLDGYTLVSVSRLGVILEDDGGAKRALKLEQPSASGR